MVTCGVAGLVGVVIAYIKRDGRSAPSGTAISKLIHAFWAWFIMMVIGIAPLGLIGIVVIGAAFVFLYRTIKGLIAAVDCGPMSEVSTPDLQRRC